MAGGGGLGVTHGWWCLSAMGWGSHMVMSGYNGLGVTHGCHWMQRAGGHTWWCLGATCWGSHLSLFYWTPGRGLPITSRTRWHNCRKICFVAHLACKKTTGHSYLVEVPFTNYVPLRKDIMNVPWWATVSCLVSYYLGGGVLLVFVWFCLFGGFLVGWLVLVLFFTSICPKCSIFSAGQYSECSCWVIFQQQCYFEDKLLYICTLLFQIILLLSEI